MFFHKGGAGKNYLLKSRMEKGYFRELTKGEEREYWGGVETRRRVFHLPPVVGGEITIA